MDKISFFFYRVFFVALPFLGLFLRNSGVIEEGDATTASKTIFDLFLIFFVLYFSLLKLKFRNFEKVKISLLIGFLGCGLLVFKLVTSDLSSFYFQPLVMEIKPIYYLIISAILYVSLDKLEVNIFRDGFLLLALLMIVGWLFKVIVLGETTYRASVLEESNYDCLLILLGVIISDLSPPKKVWFYRVVYLSAIVLSFSRTGYIAAVVIYFCLLLRHKKLITLGILAALALPVMTIVFLNRQSDLDSTADIDRLRMWLSFSDIYLTSDFFNKAFGYFPGVPIRYFDPFIQYFIEWQSEDQWKIEGLHAFNFHGMHLRLMLTWGIVGSLFFVSSFVFYFVRSQFHVKLILLLVLIEGTSMGVFYLTTVAVYIYLLIFILLDKHRIQFHS